MTSVKKNITKGPASGWPKEVCIYTDGACRGNPGPSSLGLVVYNLKGQTLYEEAALLGTQTNNFAEYSAVLRALILSVQNKVHSLLLKSDSQLLVQQLSGKYKVRSANIKSLYKACQLQVKALADVTFQHVPREQNIRADQLANLVLDGLDI